MGVGTLVGVGADIDVATCVGLYNGVRVGMRVGIGVAVGVGLGVGMRAGTDDDVAIGVGVDVGAGVGIALDVRVATGVAVGVRMDAGVGVAAIPGTPSFGSMVGARVGLLDSLPQPIIARQSNTAIAAAAMFPAIFMSLLLANGLVQRVNSRHSIEPDGPKLLGIPATCLTQKSKHRDGNPNSRYD